MPIVVRDVTYRRIYRHVSKFKVYMETFTDSPRIVLILKTQNHGNYELIHIYFQFDDQSYRQNEKNND